ncbi:energy transducer TonB [Allochromatium tepidum]|uniref:energy transducer TonB n=1 Tax=Allochromatium tepidum TaxID=553982 RepID=UPI001BCD613B|nr:energy transducer TonB [Allochromatium tepidum]
MPPAAADHTLRRTWLWLALLLSAVLHVAVAAVLWRAERPDSTVADTQPLMFELVRAGSGEASTGESPQHADADLPSSPEPASAPPPSPAAQDDAIPVPPTPALVPTPTSTPADPVAAAYKTAKPAPKTAQRHARPIKLRPTPSRTRESKERPSRPLQTKQSTVKGSTTASATATVVGKAGTAESSGRTPTTQSGESTAGQRAAERAYLAALQRAIARHQRYPAGARRHGQTGVATLAFVIEADGRLSQIRLAQSSGHDALDRSALQALTRLGRFDPIPKSLGRSAWSLRIPIRFDLE